jgi:hypothetical protein
LASVLGFLEDSVTLALIDSVSLAFSPVVAKETLRVFLIEGGLVVVSVGVVLGLGFTRVEEEAISTPR